jgi:hypothetical protein
MLIVCVCVRARVCGGIVLSVPAVGEIRDLYVLRVVVEVFSKISCVAAIYVVVGES